VVVDEDEVPAWAGTRSWIEEEGVGADALLTQAESEIFPEEPAVMIYTSGQSATPKGVWHSTPT